MNKNVNAKTRSRNSSSKRMRRKRRNKEKKQKYGRNKRKMMFKNANTGNNNDEVLEEIPNDNKSENESNYIVAELPEEGIEYSLEKVSKDSIEDSSVEFY